MVARKDSQEMIAQYFIAKITVLPTVFVLMENVIVKKDTRANFVKKVYFYELFLKISNNKKEKCSKECNFHGKCIENGTCLCDLGFSGADCSNKICPNKCSHQGKCNNNICECNSNYEGIDCSLSNLSKNFL